MLIVKKYHDYYDTAMGFDGIDKTCVYERNPVIEENKYEISQLKHRFAGDKVGWRHGPYSVDYREFLKRDNDTPLTVPFVIGFCGKTYVGYHFQWGDSYYDNIRTEIVYGPDDFFKLQPFTNSQKKYSSDKQNKEITEKYFTKFHNKEHSDLFIKYHVPIFVYDFGTGFIQEGIHRTSKAFQTNPNLSQYEFYKLFDAPTAFQEIQMFLQGVLGNKEKITVVISDQNKLLQHGFDPKWSFRNPCPPKRKSGKCKN